MDHYVKVRDLGRGAFGLATLVKQKNSRKFRVIKQVDLKLLDQGSREEVHKEVGVLRQLQHRHIVSFVDTFIAEHTLHIVMEFADGGDLSAAVKKRQGENGDGPYNGTDAMAIFAQCLLALQYIHNKMILHRDLKSQNIFLMATGLCIKIGDFGISKVMESGKMAGTVIGTPAYLAPEICDNTPYDSKVDIWALGVVLYELLSLKLPFSGFNLAVICMKILTAEPPTLPDDVAEEIKDVVFQTLRKKPDERPTADRLLQMDVVKLAAAESSNVWDASGMEQFEVLEKLGQGAFGVALKVRHKSSGMIRVVKRVETNQMSETARTETHAEVGVLRRLSHPHIIAYFDSFSDSDGSLCIVLEYADGGDLSTAIRHRLDDEDYYPEEDALRIFAQCTSALKYFHGKRILHRDIKTQNIFMMNTGAAKLGDFGISKVMENTAAIVGTVIGTPAYLAPEMIESLPYGSKVDIWSMGIVLYELLALRQPFQAANFLALAKQIAFDDPPPLPERYSEDVREVALRCLRKKPDDRPSALDLLQTPVVMNAAGPALEAITSTSGKLDDTGWGGTTTRAGLGGGTNTSVSDDTNFTMTPATDANGGSLETTSGTCGSANDSQTACGIGGVLLDCLQGNGDADLPQRSPSDDAFARRQTPDDAGSTRKSLEDSEWGLTGHLSQTLESMDGGSRRRPMADIDQTIAPETTLGETNFLAGEVLRLEAVPNAFDMEASMQGSTHFEHATTDGQVEDDALQTLMNANEPLTREQSRPIGGTGALYAASLSASGEDLAHSLGKYPAEARVITIPPEEIQRRKEQQRERELEMEAFKQELYETANSGFNVPRKHSQNNANGVASAPGTPATQRVPSRATPMAQRIPSGGAPSAKRKPLGGATPSAAQQREPTEGLQHGDSASHTRPDAEPRSAGSTSSLGFRAHGPSEEELAERRLGADAQQPVEDGACHDQGDNANVSVMSRAEEVRLRAQRAKQAQLDEVTERLRVAAVEGAHEKAEFRQRMAQRDQGNVCVVGRPHVGRHQAHNRNNSVPSNHRTSSPAWQGASCDGAPAYLEPLGPAGGGVSNSSRPTTGAAQHIVGGRPPSAGGERGLNRRPSSGRFRPTSMT